MAEEILIPKVIIIPPMFGNSANAKAGSLFISGGKLVVATSAGVFQVVTSV